MEIPLSLKATCTGLKNTFMQGLKTADFDQRLALFAKSLENEDTTRKTEHKNQQKQTNQMQVKFPSLTTSPFPSPQELRLGHGSC